jgi:hypothetical protein
MQTRGVETSRAKTHSWFLDVRAPVLQIDVHFRQHARSSATREAKEGTAATKIGLRCRLMSLASKLYYLFTDEIGQSLNEN